MKHEELAGRMHQMAKEHEPFAMATIVKTTGSTLGKPGFKVLISKDGRVIYGTLGGVCPESAIANVGVETMLSGEPRTVRVFLEDAGKAVEATVKSQDRDEIHVETNCGGVIDVYVEPYLPGERVVLVGQGGKDDVEDELVRVAKMLDYEVTVIDHAPVLTQEPDRLIKDLAYDIGGFPFAEGDSVVVLTKGERDVQTLEAALKSKAKFVGLLASRKRAKEDVEALRKRGMPEERIADLHTPIGVDIGAVTPAEIAISIMADVIAAKHGRHLPHKA
ncbi:MAG: XdhC family protein [Nitrososphaerota archaeon]|nr:XdhC family protein [Nitrososphaerota archaeon]MDG6939171.1 XdhC family protein [Nitrososphaerota archaeon]